jgi:aspartate kinase
MLLIKFGGSSVGSVENLQRVVQIVKKQTEPFIMVVSAFSGVTNTLQSLGENALKNTHQPILEALKERHFTMAKSLLPIHRQTNALVHIGKTTLALENLCNSISTLGELSERTQARIMAQGELLSSFIIGEYLNQEGVNVSYLPSEDYIVAQGDPLNAVVDFSQTQLRMQQIDTEASYIAPGYIAANPAGELVVLGRGGSDYTASIYAYCLGAKQVELWSDVNGMQNANPKLVKNTKVISQMSYEEAFEMAYFGAKVIYPPAIRPAMEKKIPVLLLNTLAPEEKGTRIHVATQGHTDKVLGVSTLSDISMITISGIGLAGTKGSARRVFQALEQADVNVILITQSCSEQSICFGIKTSDAQSAKEALEREFAQEIGSLINPIERTDNHVILALIGDNMNHQTGLSGKVFSALGANGVNIQAIAQGASERNISVVIDAHDEHKAVNVVHERLFQEVIKRVHLFIIGAGNVGGQFIDIVYKQQEYFRQQYKVDLRVVMVANSRQYVFADEGLSQETLSLLSTSGATPYASAEALAELIIATNRRNSIVVDNTASAQVAAIYPQLIRKSISVVTCNKIAGSAPLEQYTALMELVKNQNCDFQYETSVGAALPIIKTLQNLRLSGDTIHRIDAVVSGSLNFIFNHYNATTPFVEIVKQAQKEGYTEPDPRIDLSGLDVIRKILILSREAGYRKEMSEVVFESFLPEKSLETPSVEVFYKVLEENEAFFQDLYHRAQHKGAKLNVVAQLLEGDIKVSLQEIPASSPFYQLDGKDNIVAFYTDMYPTEPLVIKGAGAGAKVTASGVLSDVMYVANKQK